MHALVWTILLAIPTAGDSTSDKVVMDSVAIKVAEEVAVPAAEAGILVEVAVKPGDLVDEGTLLGRLRDDEVRLLVERTQLDMEIAERRFKNELDLRYAKKSTEVAKAELGRSNESNAKYPKTVSESELDRQRLLVEQGELEVQKAEHEQALAGITLQIRSNEHKTALDQLSRRQFRSPLKGMVVEVNRNRGEWVQPGDTVARIIRLDRLRAEGFLPARDAPLSLKGREVRVFATTEGGEELQLPGKVVYVSPEIDPLNAQVRVWVDVENSELQLRPGTVARVEITP